MLPSVPGRASGIGSWPGTNTVDAVRISFGELAEPSIAYLPELPARGPGSDLIGRSAVFLAETPVDLQPTGWRLVSRPGRDLERARAMLRQDLDVLAEVADGYTGPLKLQAAGPWTLAAGLYLPRLERAVVDPGACRDLVAALSEGLAAHVRQVRRLVPGAEVIVQIDEPSLPDVLAGNLSTASGFGRLRAIEESVVVDGLRAVVSAAADAGAVETVVHSCAREVPIEALLRTGVDGLSLDLARLDVVAWERLAPALEAGRRLWAGAIGTSAAAASPESSPAAAADAVWVPWRRLGLSPRLAAAVVVTPACGLAGGAGPGVARQLLARAVQAAKELAARAEG